MKHSVKYPRLRMDLEWVTVPGHGPSSTYLVRDREGGRGVVISAKERFVCRRLDGEISPEQIVRAFEEAFQQTLQLDQLAAMIRQLGEQGLLERVTPIEPHPVAARLRPLPLPADRWFRRTAHLFAWTYTLPGRILYWAYALLGLVALSATFDQWWPVLCRLDKVIKQISVPGAWSWERMLVVLATALMVPIIKELPKGVTCRHYGVRVPHLWYAWIFYIVPRISPDLTEMWRLDRSTSLRVLSAGIRCDLFLVATGVLGYQVLSDGNPMQQVFQVLAVISAIRLVLDVNPLGRSDGGACWAMYKQEFDYRLRAVRMFRSWLVGRTYPEPMKPAQRQRFVVYGALAEFYAWVIRLALISVLAYVLIQKLGGLGTLVFCVGILLRYRDDMVRAFRRVAGYFRIGHWRSWRPVAVVVRLAACVMLVAGIGWIVFRPGSEGLRATFEVLPHAPVILRAGVDGRVAWVGVAPGDEVEAGQVIARLDRRRLERDLAEVRAGQRRSIALLGAARDGAGEPVVAVFQQVVGSADTAVAYSERTVHRYQGLRERDRLPGAVLDAALRERDEFQAIRDLAEFRLGQAQAGVAPEWIAALQADVDAFQEQVKYLEAQLSDTEVTTAFAGRVVWVRADGSPGVHVRAGDAVARIEIPGPVRLRVSLPEIHARSVSVGARVMGRARAFSSVQLQGRVIRVLPGAVAYDQDARRRSWVQQDLQRADDSSRPGSRYIPVEVEIDDPGISLRTGMTGRVRIAGDQGRSPSPLSATLSRFWRVEGWSWIP